MAAQTITLAFVFCFFICFQLIHKHLYNKKTRANARRQVIISTKDYIIKVTYIECVGVTAWKVSGADITTVKQLYR